MSPRTALRPTPPRISRPWHPCPGVLSPTAPAARTLLRRRAPGAPAAPGSSMADNGQHFHDGENACAPHRAQNTMACGCTCSARPCPRRSTATGLLHMRGLGLPRRWPRALRAPCCAARSSAPDDNETCDSWLRRLGQDADPAQRVLGPALSGAPFNDDPLVSSAAYHSPSSTAPSSSAATSRLGVPGRPAVALYVEQALAYLRARGRDLRLGEPVRALEVTNARVTGVTLKSGGEYPSGRRRGRLVGGAAVSSDMLPGTLPNHPVYQDIARLRPSPIVNPQVLGRPRPVPGRPVRRPGRRRGISGCSTARRSRGELGGEVMMNCTISAARFSCRRHRQRPF